MKTLDDAIATLQDVHSLLRERHELLQVTADRFTAAVKDEAPDVEEIELQLRITREQYKEQQYEATRAVLGYAELLSETSAEQLARGVPLPEALVHYHPNDGAQKYSSLAQQLEELGDHISFLRQTIEVFETQQQLLSEKLQLLMEGIKDLAQYPAAAPLVGQHRAVYERLDSAFLSGHYPRQKLIGEIEEQIEACKADFGEALAQQVSERYHVLTESVARLQALGVLGDELLMLQLFDEQLDKPSKALLAEISSYSNGVALHIDEVTSDLRSRIATLRSVAEEILATLPDELAEARALSELLAQQSPQEHELPAYLDTLQRVLDEARQTGPAALEDFQAQIRANSFAQLPSREYVERLGVAIYNEASKPAEYRGPLWKTAEDIIISLVFTDNNATGNFPTLEEFYQRHGYATVVRALQTARQNGELVLALGVLSSNFLPDQNHELGIAKLLSHQPLQELLEQAVMDESLLVSQEKLPELTSVQCDAMLLLLEQQNLLALPRHIELQWAVLIHDYLASNSKLFVRATRRLLAALLRHERYVSLYYTLRALETSTPAVWELIELRPMLLPLFKQTVQLESSGYPFLLELCSHSAVRQLAEAAPDTQFMLSSVAHMLTVAGQASFYSEVWSYWQDQIAPDYPCLANVLQMHLQSQSFNVVSTRDGESDVDRLNAKLAEIQAMFEPNSSSYKSIRLAKDIHRWYVSTYFRQWHADLAAPRVPDEKIAEIQQQLRRWQKDSNLVAQCPLQQEAFDPVEGQLTLMVNRQLKKIVTLFQEATRLVRDGQRDARSVTVAYERIEQEVLRLAAVSPIAQWSLQSLLGAKLPIINDILAGTQYLEEYAT